MNRHNRTGLKFNLQSLNDDVTRGRLALRYETRISTRSASRLTMSSEKLSAFPFQKANTSSHSRNYYTRWSVVTTHPWRRAAVEWASGSRVLRQSCQVEQVRPHRTRQTGDRWKGPTLADEDCAHPDWHCDVRRPFGSTHLRQIARNKLQWGCKNIRKLTYDKEISLLH
jgi:hypothetical protein